MDAMKDMIFKKDIIEFIKKERTMVNDDEQFILDILAGITMMIISDDMGFQRKEMENDGLQTETEDD